MMRLCLILYFIPLHLTYAQIEDKNTYYDTYMDIAKPGSSDMKTFRFGDIQDMRNESILTHRCPAETDEYVSNLEIASARRYKLKYCLVKKDFKPHEKILCKKEVKPVFMESTDKLTKSPKICGYSQSQSVHYFSFHFCDEEGFFEDFRRRKFRDEPEYYEYVDTNYYPYRICYDKITKEVVWTMNTVQTPPLFQNPYLKSRESPKTEISTNPYYMDSDLFVTLERQYELEKNKDLSIPGNFKMVPKPLVPPEHYAIPLLRKATNHYINMAPLWEKLEPLMDAINEGIKKAQLKLESESPQVYGILKTYTRVALTPEDYYVTTPKTWFSLMLFKSNIWFKLVLRNSANMGALIIIHNTPGKPPSNGCLVGTPRSCYFEEWSNDEKIREAVVDTANKYAFCCHPSKNDIMTLFNFYTVDLIYLDMDALVISDQKPVSRL